MNDYSDAALLKGNYAHLAAELRAGRTAAPSKGDWDLTAQETEAERAAQAVGKEIFALQEQIDTENERLEIFAFTAAGPMTVTGVVPIEDGMLRIDGHLHDKRPVAQIVHATQLALTITKSAINDVAEDDDGLQIGFVIFDELVKRADRKTPNDPETEAPKAEEK